VHSIRHGSTLFACPLVEALWDGFDRAIDASLESLGVTV
jgi:hypothetical protein